VHHFDLTPMVATRLELAAEVAINCKIACFEQCSPCIVNFSYHGKGDIKVYASLTYPVPESRNHDVRAKGRPEKLIIANRDLREHFFSQNFIYLTILCKVDLDITLETKFNTGDVDKIHEMQRRNAIRAKKKYEQSELEEKMVEATPKEQHLVERNKDLSSPRKLLLIDDVSSRL